MSFSCSQTEMISYDISINMIKLHLFTTGLAMAKNDESLDSPSKILSENPVLNKPMRTTFAEYLSVTCTCIFFCEWFSPSSRPIL